MKRRDLIRHLKAHGCKLLREGGNNHSVYINRAAQTTSAIPRYREINGLLARKICRDGVATKSAEVTKTFPLPSSDGDIVPQI